MSDLADSLSTIIEALEGYEWDVQARLLTAVAKFFALGIEITPPESG